MYFLVDCFENSITNINNDSTSKGEDYLVRVGIKMAHCTKAMYTKEALRSGLAHLIAFGLQRGKLLNPMCIFD